MTKADKDLEIRPVTQDQSKKMSQGFIQLANAMQVFLNAAQRQVLTNLGTIALNADKKRPEINAQTLAGGFSSRLAYNGLVTYPCLAVRKTLQEQEAPQYQINFATAFTDAALGTPLEVNGSLKTLRLLGVNISQKDILSVSTKTFFPFFLRNQLTWCAINNVSQDDLLTKVGVGASAGAASTWFHNVGMKTMEHAANKTWEQTWEAVSNEVRSNPNLFKGAHLRALSISAATILLSPQATNFFSEKCREIFDSGRPSQSPSKPSSQAVIDPQPYNKR